MLLRGFDWVAKLLVYTISLRLYSGFVDEDEGVECSAKEVLTECGNFGHIVDSCCKLYVVFGCVWTCLSVSTLINLPNAVTLRDCGL
jgi:hypothetical protein